MKKPTCNCLKNLLYSKDSSIDCFFYDCVGALDNEYSCISLNINFCPECGEPYKEETSGEEKETQTSHSHAFTKNSRA